MPADARSLLPEYPALARPAEWGVVRCQFHPTVDAADLAIVSNVNLVPFAGSLCVLIRLDGGSWDVPGGTLEPGEPYVAALERELREEAGARLLSFTPFGVWRCHSSAAVPYRPHIPHPDFCRLAGYGDVEITGKPTTPAGGERIAEVAVVSAEEAERRLRAAGRPELAALYALAARIKAG